MHQTVHQYKIVPTIPAVLERKTEKENKENSVGKIFFFKRKKSIFYNSCQIFQKSDFLSLDIFMSK